MNPWPGYSFMYLAEELGFFEDEGISVRLVEMDSLADVRCVFERGHADMICCSLVEVLLLNDRQDADSVKCVTAIDYSNGCDMLLARDQIGSLAELRGCKIGLEPESLDVLTVYLALKSAGLRMDDVELVPLAQAEMLQAMQSGSVDAVPIYPPASDAIKTLAGVHCLWDSSAAPSAVLDVLATQETFLAEHPQAVSGVLRACRRAQRFYASRPEKALAILSRRCRTSPQTLQSFMSGIAMLTADSEQNRKLFDAPASFEVTHQTAQALLATGMLQRLPRETPFDGRFLETQSK
jgi:NitT/TauT family transport system substrate-binding protein